MEWKEGNKPRYKKLRKIKIRYFSEISTAMFCNQTQSEYYGINQSVSIEGIAVDHVSERQNGSNSNYLSYENGSTFHSFM